MDFSARTTLLATTTILNSMFILSGVDKVMHFEKVVDGLITRTQMLSKPLSRVMILSAIIIELCAPTIVMKACLTPDRSWDKWAAYSSLALILFTILATLIYHFPPFTSAKYYPFMSNLSAVGGLSLMYSVFASRSVL
tara:strand:- start:865 stop:1278 length:414 start_codon:yes stop_codon:yes gene_type:complete